MFPFFFVSFSNVFFFWFVPAPPRQNMCLPTREPLFDVVPLLFFLLFFSPLLSSPLLSIIISTAAQSWRKWTTWMRTESPIIWTPTSHAGPLTPTAKSATTSYIVLIPASVPAPPRHAGAPSAMLATTLHQIESARSVLPLPIRLPEHAMQVVRVAFKPWLVMMVSMKLAVLVIILDAQPVQIKTIVK